MTFNVCLAIIYLGMIMENKSEHIKVITVPAGGKGFSGFNFILNFTAPNENFKLTRKIVEQLDSKGSESWWKSYIVQIAKGKPVWLDHRPVYLDALRNVGLIIDKELLR